MQALLDRYIARLMFTPLLITLLISAMLFLLIRMAELFDLIIGGGGTGETVLRVLANLAPQYIALVVPMGLLMAVLMAFRRLALNAELDAMLGTGVSYTRMLRVPLLYAAVLTLPMAGIVAYVQPLSVYRYEKLLFDLGTGVLGVSIRVGEFTPIGDNLIVRAEKSRRRGQDLAGVFAATHDADGNLVVLTAARGTITQSTGTRAPDGETSVARLFDGRIARINEQTGESEAAGFDVYEMPLDLPAVPVFRARGNSERELTAGELIDVARAEGAGTVPARAAQAGLLRRAAQVLVLFFLPLLGVPLARPPSRSTSGLGVFLGLAAFIIYNELSLFGERLGMSGQTEALPAQAASFFPFGALCFAVFVLFALRPGEPPLARLVPLVNGLARLFGRRAQTESGPA